MPAIPAIITGIATVGGTAIAAHGNTEAAKTSAASDDKALAQAKEIYDQQRADQGPYRQSGYGALDALNFGMGLPSVNAAGTGGKVPAAPLPQSTIAGLTFPGSPQVPPNTLNALNTAVTGGGRFSGLAGSVQSKVNQAQQLANQQFGGSGATVKIKAPNGLVYLVPSDQVATAQQKGGQLV